MPAILIQHTNKIASVLIFGLLLVAWTNRFVYDDAFISFRYAQHLAEGHGLVWNIGETPIEGYTNFLWTILMSIAFVIAIDPVIFSWVVSLGCFVVSLLATYALAQQYIKNKIWSLITVVFLGTNYTFSAFATSGLETQLQAMLFVSSTYLVHQIISHQKLKNSQLFLLSILFAIALLTRLDSAIVVGILGLATLYHLMQVSSDSKTKLIQFIILSIPVISLVGVWLLWKLAFYGDILPNTFYAKVGGNPIFLLVRGLLYIAGFYLSYWLIPFPFIFVANIFRRKVTLFDSILLFILGIWTLYILYIGGDFMEFRFMVPILPLLMLTIVNTIANRIDKSALQLGLVIAILMGNVWHYFTFDRLFYSVMQESLVSMQYSSQLNRYDWDTVGQVLGASFDYDRTVTIAVNPAGFIPFYARSRTIDMLGLNDRWIAENGVPYLNLAAHEQISTFDYLLEQNVNVLIDQPKLIPNTTEQVYSTDDLGLFHVEITPETLPQDAVYLVIPINRTHDLLTLYLNPHPTVDRAIEEFGWQTYPINPS